jgi:hypothetical protein
MILLMKYLDGMNLTAEFDWEDEEQCDIIADQLIALAEDIREPENLNITEENITLH